MKFWKALVLVCSVAMIAAASPRPVFAQTSGWAFKCPDGSLPDAGGSCNKGRSSSSSGSNADRDAEAREARDRAANDAYWLKRNAQIDSARKDSIRRADALKAQQRLNAEQRQRQFETDKAQGISELRTDLKNSDLKDAVVSGDLATSNGSFGGGSSSPRVRKAYGQAFCGLSLLNKAINQLGERGALPSESRYLVDQAAIVFDGEKPEVACPPTPDVQLTSSVDMTKIIAREKAVLKKVEAVIDRGPSSPKTNLTADEERIQAAYRKQKANETTIAEKDAPVIEGQRKINDLQQRKYSNDAVQIKRDQQVRDKLKEIVENATENMKTGNVDKALNDLSVNLDNLLSKPATGKSTSTRKAR